MKSHNKSLQKIATYGALALVLMTMPALVSNTGVNLGSLAVAAEDDRPKSKYAEKKTKRVQAMSPAFAKKFQKIDEAAQAGNLPEMKVGLDEITQDMDRYSEYEQATTWNYLAYYYYEVEDLKAALNAYQKVVSFYEYLTDAFVARTLYSIAQLHYLQEDYRKAIDAMYEWMDVTENVTPESKMLLCQAHYQVGEFDQSLRWVEEAIADYQSEGKVPKENWWRIQRAIYYDKKNMPKVAEILETMVVYYPKARYWRQLGGIYSELGRDLDTLVAYDVLHIQNLLEKDMHLRNLAHMYLGAEVPYKAAQIIEWGMKKGYIEESVKDLKMLAEALYQANEVKRSIPIMERAAKMSDDGVLMERLAGMYYNDDQYKEAIDAANEARRKGGLKRPGGNYMYEGMALASLERYSEAEKVFRKAAEYEKSKKAAQGWIKYVQNEKRRLDEIRKSRERFSS